jgi:Transposase, Mutator family
MALDQSVLSELLDAFRSGEGLGVIKQAAALVCHGLIEVELTAQIGPDRCERTDSRSNERNGHWPRVLSTNELADGGSRAETPASNLRASSPCLRTGSAVRMRSRGR